MGLQGPAKDPHKEMSGSTMQDSNRGSLLRESGTLTTIRLTPDASLPQHLVIYPQFEVEIDASKCINSVIRQPKSTQEKECSTMIALHLFEKKPSNP